MFSGQQVDAACSCPGDPRQNLIVHRGRLLDLRKVPGAIDDLHPRPAPEVTLSVLDEREIDAPVAVPVQVQGRLRPGASQGHLLSRVRAIHAEVVEPRLLGSVVARGRPDLAAPAGPLPPQIATHNPDQVFYFDDLGIQRRMDYITEVNGSTLVGHYTSRYKTFRWPARRDAPPGLPPQPRQHRQPQPAVHHPRHL